MNDVESLKVGLGFIYHWKELNVAFQHKDIMILFYENTSYSLGTKNFLKQYLDEEQILKGRCGTIRHAFTVYEFNDEAKAVSVVADGKNFNMNDQNLYFIVRNALKANKLKFDVHYPHSYSKNEFWRNALSNTKEVRNTLDQTFNSLFTNLKQAGVDVPYNSAQTPIIFLDSLKNQLLGNLHFPQNDFLDKGIYSVTFLPFAKSNSKILENYISTLEVLLMTLDTLDTHEHSGTMQYFFVDINRHVTLQNYPIPILIFVASMGLPYVFKFPQMISTHNKHFAMSLVVVLVVHFWGFTIYHISNILLSNYQERRICYPFEHLSKSEQNKYFEDLKLALMITVPSCTAGFLILYKIIQGTVARSAKNVVSAYPNKPAKKFMNLLTLSLQCIFGVLIHPAFGFFTAVIFLPLYGIKLNFFKLPNSERLKYFIFFAVYAFVVYCLSHFNYTSRLEQIMGGKINSFWAFVGEMYKDTQCADNLLLFFIWASWIPNAVNYVISNFDHKEPVEKAK